MSEHRVECVRSLSAQLDPDMVLYLVLYSSRRVSLQAAKTEYATLRHFVK